MGVLERLRRPDWLGELQTALIVSLVLLSVLAVVNIVAIAGGWHVTAAVPAGAVDGVGGATGGLAPGVAVDPQGTVDVLVDNPSAGQAVAAVLVFLPTLLVVVTLFAMLLGVVRRARSGGPFDERVVRHLRLIGVVAIAAGIIAHLVEFFAQLSLTSTVTSRSITATLSLQNLLGWVLVGMALFAIAEVVRRGLVMRTDLDTVI